MGRFGLNIVKSITKLIDQKTFEKIERTRLLTSLPKRIHDSVLVSYIPEINKELCDSINIDITKARNYDLQYEENNDNIIDIENTYPSVSVVISAAVTAYGRIHITKLKKKILELGGDLYYSDTDSIATDIELPKDMVDSKEIGKLKKEYFVERGYFISGKTYCLVLNNENVIIKAKGMKSYNLSENDYIKMLHGETIDTAIKITGIKDYEDGSVTITKDDKVKLNREGYTRREKVYKNNIWVDTKPLVISHPGSGKSDSEVLSNKTNPPNKKISNNTRIMKSSLNKNLNMIKTHFNKSTLAMYIVFTFCCILYFVSILLSDGENSSESVLDIVESSELSIISNVENLYRPTTIYNEIQNRSCEYNILDSLNSKEGDWVQSSISNKTNLRHKDRISENNLLSNSDSLEMSKNLFCLLRDKNGERTIKTNYGDSKILDEVYKLEYEKEQKQYSLIDAETLKSKKQLDELQKRIVNLSNCEDSKEFNKLPRDIQTLAKENIYDEKRYLINKKSENLNKLRNLRLKAIDCLCSFNNSTSEMKKRK